MSFLQSPNNRRDWGYWWVCDLYLYYQFSSIFFQAVGKPVFAVLTSLIRDIICFVPLVCIMPVFLGIDGILFAAPIADTIAILITAALTVIFFVGIKKKIRHSEV